MVPGCPGTQHYCLHQDQWLSIVLLCSLFPSCQSICLRSCPLLGHVGCLGVCVLEGKSPTGCAERPAGGARPGFFRCAVWARWTERGGGNQQRPVVAARNPPPPPRNARDTRAWRGHGRRGYLSSELGHHYHLLLCEESACSPLRSAPRRTPWRRKHKVGGRRSPPRSVPQVHRETLFLEYLTLPPDRQGHPTGTELHAYARLRDHACILCLTQILRWGWGPGKGRGPENRVPGP